MNTLLERDVAAAVARAEAPPVPERFGPAETLLIAGLMFGLAGYVAYVRWWTRVWA